MSVVSDRHTVVPFVSGKSQALNEQRLAKIGYKTTAKQAAKFPSVCVSVPVITDDQIADSGEALIPHVRTLLAAAQDGIIRSLYESSDGTLRTVSDAEISVNACIAFLEAEATGGRLTTDAINQWFDSQVSENLIVPMAEKLGFSELNDAQMDTVNKHIKAYRAVIASLASGVTMLQPVQIRGCRFAISLAASDDTEIGKKLVARLDVMSAPKPVAELLELA